MSRSLKAAIRQCTSCWSTKSPAQTRRCVRLSREKKGLLHRHQRGHWEEMDMEQKVAAWTESVAERQPGLIMSLLSGRMKSQTRIGAVRVGDNVMCVRGPVHN